MNKRMDKNKLNIGTYYLKPYACTENHVKGLKQCGIDFVVCMQNETFALDLLEKEGIGAIVSGVVPPWWGNRGENAGTMKETNKLQLYSNAVKTFKDHSAIWGIDCGDEPSSLDFRHCGEIVNLVNKKFKNQFAYFNLYANYGLNTQNSITDIAKQLGTCTYDDYIRQYCDNVHTDYICCDFYIYSADVDSFFKNLSTVSNACIAYNRSMWIVLQVNSSASEKYLSLNQLRFQAYSAMAFGTQCIIWACYCPGWWYNNVLNEQGEKTEQYEKLKEINYEIKKLSEEYMNFKTVATHTVEKTLIQSITGAFSYLESSNKLLVGEMISKKHDKTHALFIFAADDPYDNCHQKSVCTFSLDAKSIKLITKNGKQTIYPQNNFYRIILSSNEAGLVIINL